MDSLLILGAVLAAYLIGKLMWRVMFKAEVVLFLNLEDLEQLRAGQYIEVDTTSVHLEIRKTFGVPPTRSYATLDRE